MEGLTDITSEIIVPYLIHFGERGYTPKIFRVDGGEILRIRKAEGPRLSAFLETASREQLERLYMQLGVRVGYISKYHVVHGHLHTDNVIVERDKPVIIDWGQGSYVGIVSDEQDQHYRFWMGQNSGMLLESTRERLEAVGKEDLFSELRGKYSEAFRRELFMPQCVTPQQLQRIAFELYRI